MEFEIKKTEKTIAQPNKRVLLGFFILHLQHDSKTSDNSSFLYHLIVLRKRPKIFFIQARKIQNLFGKQNRQLFYLQN